MRRGSIPEVEVVAKEIYRSVHSGVLGRHANEDPICLHEEHPESTSISTLL